VSLSSQATKTNGGRADLQTTRRIRRFQRVYWLAAHSYRCRPYDGRVTVLANTQWYDADPTLGWGNLSTGGVEIHKIPGNHITYITDNIHLVAKVLKESLEKAQTRPR
jgi:surfactin synthase thioesterase subunit